MIQLKALSKNNLQKRNSNYAFNTIACFSGLLFCFLLRTIKLLNLFAIGVMGFFVAGMTTHFTKKRYQNAQKATAAQNNPFFYSEFNENNKNDIWN